MKTRVGAVLAALLFVSLALPVLVNAGPSGPSATGSFQFTLEDGATRFLEFNAREQNNGRIVGQMTFSDPAAIVVPDPDGSEAQSQGALVRAKFDCLKITGNRAVMSGVIFDSNVFSAVGLRVLLVVEDGGEGVNAANDKLTWGIFQPPANGWTPKDAERDDDNGAGLTWIAKDFEREDDIGVPSNQSKTVGCGSFSLATFDFTNIAHGGGNLQVQQ